MSPTTAQIPHKPLTYLLTYFYTCSPSVCIPKELTITLTSVFVHRPRQGRRGEGRAKAGYSERSTRGGGVRVRRRINRGRPYGPDWFPEGGLCGGSRKRGRRSFRRGAPPRVSVTTLGRSGSRSGSSLGTVDLRADASAT